MRLAWLIPLVMAAPLHAAPLCVEVLGVPRQCLYVDPAQCEREAARQGGNCTGNPAELRTPRTAARFCTVESGNALVCAYADRATCRAAAARRGGACIEASRPAGAPAVVDPYQVRRPY